MQRTIVNRCILILPALACATLIIFASMLSGCGRKAPPKPPRVSSPPQVIDLGYSISEDSVKLSWTIPETSDKDESPATGFIIYRSKQSVSEADCANCPITFTKIDDVPVRAGASGRPDSSVVFAETIEPGYRYIYKIKAYDDDGVAGKDSNLIDFTY
ncbi:MAG: hypothetical protein AB1Z29_24370 [Desulfobacterales bacterium]|jgi:hypothetical protein